VLQFAHLSPILF